MGDRIRKVVGGAETATVADARNFAARALTANRRGGTAPPDFGGTLFETVAETVFERYARVWKPRTPYVNRCYQKKQNLPHFSERKIDEIDRRDVREWFAFLRATPVAADRSMPVLSPQRAGALPVRRRDAPPVGKAAAGG